MTSGQKYIIDQNLLHFGQFTFFFLQAKSCFEIYQEKISDERCCALCNDTIQYCICILYTEKIIKLMEHIFRILDKNHYAPLLCRLKYTENC